MRIPRILNSTEVRKAHSGNGAVGRSPLNDISFLLSKEKAW